MDNNLFLFHSAMKKAAAQPAEFLDEVKALEAPDYWEEFWAYYAAIRLGNEEEKERFYEKYIGEEEDGNNFHLLLAYENYLHFLNDPTYLPYVDFGLDFLSLAEEDLSPFLTEAFDALYSLFPNEDKELPAEENFYTQQLFVP